MAFTAPITTLSLPGSARPISSTTLRSVKWTHLSIRRSAKLPNAKPVTAMTAASTNETKTEPAIETLVPSTADQADQKDFKAWQIRIFYSIFMGYASFLLTRNSFTYVAPVMRQTFGYSLEQVGIIMSVFPLAYGFSKLVAGILSDRFSTRLFMSVGLAATGLINILFGFQSSITAFVTLWLLNGFFQAAGAPPCAKLLTSWYDQKERGRWWGFWNTSSNTGGFIIPLLAGFCARAFGWKYGMIVPGVISVLMSFFLYNRLRDDPQAVSLPPVDSNKPKQLSAEKSGAANVEKESENEMSPREKLTKYVLLNKNVWLLALSYFFVYFVRQGISSWAHVFLLEHKGVANAQEAAFRVSGMEIGGLLGSLSSGWVSDKVMNGRRIPIIVAWLFGVMASVSALWFVPAAWRYLSWITVFAIGFFIYGPQMLVGLAGAEIVDKSAVSTTIGLLGWIAYLGAAVSGYPLTKIVTSLGWKAYFISLVGFSGAAVLMLLPMWKLGKQKTSPPSPRVSEPSRESQLAKHLSNAEIAKEN